MANHLPETAMNSQADIATLASWRPSASLALQDGSIATAVLEEDDLLLLLQSLADAAQQLGREETAHQLLPSHFLHVDDLDIRQLHACKARLQGDESILADEGVVVRFQARRGRPQQGFRSSLFCKHQSGVTRVVAGRRVLLFERRFMLFVDDEKAQIPEGKEEAAPHANHDVVGFVAKHLLV